MSDAWRERVATILEIIARDRLPNPHDLDVALDAIECETADEIERLRAERDRLREALQWMVDNDDTNTGDEPLYDHGGLSWNEINAYWIAGLNRASTALKETGHE
jgi:hypothetical protein